VTRATAAAPFAPENRLNEGGGASNARVPGSRPGHFRRARLNQRRRGSVRPQPAHARSDAQVSGPAHWCYRGRGAEPMFLALLIAGGALAVLASVAIDSPAPIGDAAAMLVGVLFSILTPSSGPE
jgi:hypothetical protein